MYTFTHAQLTGGGEAIESPNKQSGGKPIALFASATYFLDSR